MKAEVSYTERDSKMFLASTDTVLSMCRLATTHILLIRSPRFNFTRVD